MRSVFFVFSIFGVLIILIAVNCIYIGNISNELINAAKDLPCTDSEDCILYVNRLREHWESNKERIKISVSLEDIDEVDRELSALELYARHKNELSFEISKENLKIIFSDLGKYEKFHFWAT